MSMTNGVLERSFQAELRDVMERHVDDEMLVGSAGRLTGGEVLRRCEAIRDELLFAGLDVGEYVACAGNGDIDMMIASMGIMLAGGIPLPMQLFREVESWSVGLAQSHARFLVAEETCERLVADVMRGFGVEPAVVLVALDGSVCILVLLARMKTLTLTLPILAWCASRRAARACPRGFSCPMLPRSTTSRRLRRLLVTATTVDTSMSFLRATT